MSVPKIVLNPQRIVSLTHRVTGVMDFATRPSPTNQTIYFVISNENLIASVSVNFSVRFEEVTSQSPRFKVVLLVSVILLMVIAAMGAFIFVIRHVRWRFTVREDAESVPLVSSSDETSDNE